MTNTSIGTPDPFDGWNGTCYRPNGETKNSYLEQKKFCTECNKLVHLRNQGPSGGLSLSKVVRRNVVYIITTAFAMCQKIFVAN